MNLIATFNHYFELLKSSGVLYFRNLPFQPPGLVVYFEYTTHKHVCQIKKVNMISHTYLSLAGIAIR